MRKIFFHAGALALALFLTGCSGGDVITATKPLEPLSEVSSSAVELYPSEFPSALEELPTDPPAPPREVSSHAGSEPEPSFAGASSEQPEESASSEAPSSVEAPAPSSETPSSPETPPQEASHPFEVTDPDGSFIVVPQEPGNQQSASQSGAPAEPAKEDAADPDRYDELQAQAPVSTVSVPNEVRAVWISYLDFYTLAQNKSRSQFSANIDEAFANISDYGLNTVFLQVRPFGDAMYRSDYFPWSYVLTGTEGEDPGYDPLEIMVSKAKEYGLRTEAWINPYRVRAIGSSRTLSASNPAVKALNAGKDTAIAWQGGLFYNPASETARDLITDGVVELVENYAIDGVHFDDYFYPTTDLSFDAAYYNAYVKAGGTLSQAEWRRRNVDLLIRQVYTAIKQADSSVIFGISPQARMDNNYNGQFIDVKGWINRSGYVDYICPQIYFGFQNQTVPYASSLAEWDAMTENSGVQLYVGLAVYKCGAIDQWAGAGQNEWVNENDLLQRMVSSARNSAKYGGFALYRYDSIFHPESGVKKRVEQEKEHLSSIL